MELQALHSATAHSATRGWCCKGTARCNARLLLLRRGEEVIQLKALGSSMHHLLWGAAPIKTRAGCVGPCAQGAPTSP